MPPTSKPSSGRSPATGGSARSSLVRGPRGSLDRARGPAVRTGAGGATFPRRRPPPDAWTPRAVPLAYVKVYAGEHEGGSPASALGSLSAVGRPAGLRRHECSAYDPGHHALVDKRSAAGRRRSLERRRGDRRPRWARCRARRPPWHASPPPGLHRFERLSPGPPARGRASCSPAPSRRALGGPPSSPSALAPHLGHRRAGLPPRRRAPQERDPRAPRASGLVDLDEWALGDPPPPTSAACSPGCDTGRCVNSLLRDSAEGALAAELFDGYTGPCGALPTARRPPLAHRRIAAGRARAALGHPGAPRRAGAPERHNRAAARACPNRASHAAAAAAPAGRRRHEPRACAPLPARASGLGHLTRSLALAGGACRALRRRRAERRRASRATSRRRRASAWSSCRR